MELTTPPQLPERLNIADRFLDARVREGLGGRIAIRTDAGTLTFDAALAFANRFANALTDAGLEPEHRVLLALPDGPEFVAALFGVLKTGGVAVMVNPGLPVDDIRHLLAYSRARLVVAQGPGAAAFRAAAEGAKLLKAVCVVDEPEWKRRIEAASPVHEPFATHADDPAIWLFSGGTTGRPKAVVQTHRSFAYTTECYGKGVLRYTPDDITLAVSKLYFGYATGANLFFPFSVGASTALFPEPATPESVFERIRQFRPTVLINVPTMIQKMVTHPDAKKQDLSSLRLVTSAGEALPAELYERWKKTFGVELLDGLGTAEMWHIFLSNRPGAVKPGTIGTVVPGFEVRVCDDEGRELGPDETGWLWVRGGARAIGYWQHSEKTAQAFRGEWYVSGDLVSRDADGYFTYCGRGDELLKVSGKWLAPAEVEGCLLQHPAVEEAAVVGVKDSNGLVKPHAYVVPRDRPDRDRLAEELKAFVRDRLAPFKHPREVIFVDELPRTHLGKVDRGKLRQA
jgi:benzoate-CoA ligase family protein